MRQHYLAGLAPTLVVPSPSRHAGAETPPRTTKRIGVMGLALALALAMSAVTAASALAFGPEFDASVYNPAVEWKGKASNVQGFSIGATIIDCNSATTPTTFNTNEELGIIGGGKEATNTKTNATILVTHPTYSGPAANEKCRATGGPLAGGTFLADFKTKGCNFKTFVTKPGPLPAAGEVEILCAEVKREGEVTEKSPLVKGLSSTKNIFEHEFVTGTKIPAGTEVSKVLGEHEVQLTAAVEGPGTATVRELVTFKVRGIEITYMGFTPGCVVTILPQRLTSFAFENKPETGSPEKAEVTTKAEVSSLKVKATSACAYAVGEGEFAGEYREGAIVGPAEEPKMEPKGHPATWVFKGQYPGEPTRPIAVAVGVNEPHWYEQGLGLGKSGGKEGEGLDTLSWGTLTLTNATIGELVCQNEAVGDVYNPAGAEFASINNEKGETEIGKLQVDAWHMDECTDTECEALDKSKMAVEAEGLGVNVNVTTKQAEFGRWEGTLLPGGAELAIGNEVAASPTQIRFHLLCPATTGGEINVKATGKLHPKFEGGSTKGSSPAIETFFGSGELEVSGGTKAQVTGKLKVFGFESGEYLGARAP